MSRTIPINLAIEAALDEEVLRKLLLQAGRGYVIGTSYGGRGIGYLRKTVPGFNFAARGTPFAVLTDLDTEPCPPHSFRNWLPQPQHPNSSSRGREGGGSLAPAHREAMARFLGIREDLVPRRWTICATLRAR